MKNRYVVEIVGQDEAFIKQSFEEAHATARVYAEQGKRAQIWIMGERPCYEISG